ncbi:MAG: glycogen synthase GlgA [Pirellulaceae bacterium]
MKILVVSSEVVPFAKTGGLADVCGALPVALQRAGHEVVVFMPGYRVARDAGLPIEETDVQLEVPVGEQMVSGRLMKSHLPNSDVVVYLAGQNDYFDRPGLYQNEGQDYPDNCSRFVFFCRFVLESLAQLGWRPDLVHCNDWHTGLIPAYLRTLYAEHELWRDTPTLMTIHNLAYQGSYPADRMPLTGLDWEYFNWRQMEFHEHLNLLKTGIVFADAVSTVSPRYAMEIQTAEQGHGLDAVLRSRRNDLTGVLNGIDIDVWNPKTDPHLATNYDAETWLECKPACKADLQQRLGMTVNADAPLIGVIGRMTAQKGWELIIEVMQRWLGHIGAQWVVLGTGDAGFQDSLRQLKERFPDQLGLELGFSDPLAHQIEAGADLFLMPSRFEPCGLNQQYSMRYGTVPVVHETGGLADTVVNLSEATLQSRTANGFSFDHYDAGALDQSLMRGVNTMIHDKLIWRQMIETGMRQDWSWSASASRYVQLYELIRQSRSAPPQPA